MKGTINPCGDYVLLEPLLPDEQTAGGIILPVKAREAVAQLGKVVAHGPKAREVQVGDTAVLDSHEQIEVHWEGRKYLMVHEREISGVLV